MHNFVRFHAIESETLSQEFWKKRNSSAPYKDICTEIASLLFIKIFILNINFCAILFSRNRDQLIRKMPEKVILQRHMLSNVHINSQKSIYVMISLNVKFHENMCISSRAKFLSRTYRQTLSRSSQIVFRTFLNG